MFKVGDVGDTLPLNTAHSSSRKKCLCAENKYLWVQRNVKYPTGITVVLQRNVTFARHKDASIIMAAYDKSKPIRIFKVCRNGNGTLGILFIVLLDGVPAASHQQ